MRSALEKNVQEMEEGGKRGDCKFNMVKVGHVKKVAFAFPYLKREQYNSKSIELFEIIM